MYPLRTGLTPQAGIPKKSRPLVRGPNSWLRGVAASSAVVLATGLMIGAVAGTPAQAAPGDPTVISLTFDDTNDNQFAAAETMKTLGLHGTFYTTSGWIGLPSYMTLAELTQLQADGNEIGGHTVSHASLIGVSAAEATRQVCNDRVALTNQGFRVTSFAYPFADTNAATELIVEGCGYNSARGLGDLKSTPDTDPNAQSAPVAETIPPADPYVLAAPIQVDSAWSLADLQASVTSAQGTGGWVPLTFHHIAVGTEPTLTISPTIFDQFVTWLAGQQTAGNVIVKTVDQVIGGAVKPLVAGPDLPPPPPPGTNMIQNPGMETIENGFPTCWEGTGFGVNTATYTVVSPGRSGNSAGNAVMANYTSGDGKFLQTLDTGTCAPAGTPGHTYMLSAWYKSTAATQFEAYYRSAAGAWEYWTASPQYLASNDWTQVTWTTPALPAGATSISWGMNIQTNGTITTDDYSMLDVTSLTAFTAAPVPTIAGLPVSGQLLTATAGAWAPAPDTLTYQWNANGVVIPGATASTYLLASTDIGKTISVTVSGTKTGYIATSNTSTATAAVTAAAPTAFTTAPVPTITGLPVSGQQLTATAGIWAPAPDTLTYKWNANGVAITGATASTYTLTSTDIGKAITVTVTGTKAGYVTTDKTSIATPAVTAPAPTALTPAPVPTVTGSSVSGQPLTVNTGTWGPAPVALSLQWKRNGVAISGATASTYTLTSTDIGKSITVTVTGTKAGYLTTAKTSVAVIPTSAVTRIGGADRYAVSAAVSKSAFSPGVSIAYVASGAVFPDALSGAPAAAKAGGPVLLTPTNSITAEVKAELARLKPQKIVVLGGPGTVTNNVLNALKVYSPTVTRIGGADRYAVSAAVSKSAFSPGVSIAYVASGAVFPDALSGAPAAAKAGGPVLLTPTNSITAEVKAELARLKPQKIVVLGGPGTVTNNVLNALKVYSPTVTRIGGADRYAVSAAVSKSAFTPGVDIVYIASGAVFPDALSGAPAAAKAGGPVLLTPTNSITAEVKAELNRLNPKRIIVLGGPGTVSNSVQSQLAAYIG